MKKGKLQWTEIYTSLQGEGLKIGDPSYFVRFSPCNLSCANCDTKFSAYEIVESEQRYSTVDEIIEEMRKLSKGRAYNEWWPNSVIFTGGEPLIQDHELLTDLCRRLKNEIGGFHITFETNCVQLPSLSLQRHVDFWSVSPKPETTAFKVPPPGCKGGKVRFEDEIFNGFLSIGRSKPEALQMKFVVCNEEEIQWLQNTLRRFPGLSYGRKTERPHIVLQADNQTQSLDDYLKRSEWLIDQIVADPFWRDYNVRTIMQQHRILWANKRGV